MIQQSAVLDGQGPVVFTYSYEPVGNGIWRKGSRPTIEQVTEPPSPSMSFDRNDDCVLVHVYNACPVVGTELSREMEARSMADKVLRRRYRGCTILNPNEGRG